MAKICVLTPMYERGDSFKEKVYTTFQKQTYDDKVLLVWRNGEKSSKEVDDYWNAIQLNDERVKFENMYDS